MSWTILLGALWVIAATVVALLPMRRQYAPGVVLLIMAPVVIVAIGYDFGLLAGLLALAGFVSMFRNPLRYFWRKAFGPAERTE